jgi:hypothetical protein
MLDKTIATRILDWMPNRNFVHTRALNPRLRGGAVAAVLLAVSLAVLMGGAASGTVLRAASASAVSLDVNRPTFP